MYKIIGADQKEYGPITAEQIRQWIAEGRVNGQTQVQDAAGGDWKPLASVPELAAALAPAAAPPLPAMPGLAGGAQPAAVNAVRGPAIALLVNAILNMLLGVWSLVRLTFFRASVDQMLSRPPFNDPQIRPQMETWMHMIYGPLGLVSTFLGLAVSVLILIGALRMQNLRNYTLAYVCAVLSMIPCVTPCCLLGLGFGIWAVVVLNRPEIKAQFS